MIEIFFRKRHGVEGLHGAKRPLGDGAVGIDERKHHVAQHGGARQQVERLEHEAETGGSDLGQAVVVELGDIESLEEVAARGRAVEAAERVHERRLARARRAHDAEELALAHGQGHAFERMREPRLHLIDAMDIAHVEDDLLSAVSRSVARSGDGCGLTEC